MRLIAVVNRGEAAMRCIRSVKALRALEGSDLQVVALYTDVDRDAPFVRHADQAYRLPLKTTAVAAYLDHEQLVRTLQSIGADAVWPGWGFVAESPEFVDRLAEAGITFLGPTSDTMRRLGDKIASKQLAEAVNVPVSAWSGGALAGLSAAEAAAEQVGYPLVIKASAGGGGRGIRMVHKPEQLEPAFISAASEAKTAFGDDRLFLEAMVRGGRHIEVQVVADKHGNVFAVGCRDCSVQRRHQKVIEEAPPVGLSDALLAGVKESARRLASEVGYHGVGTVEFLVCAPDFYFLEMNPRLQVEHGITEEVTGLDLVELQIRIARGESLADLTAEEEGFCIEARVCAEDPDQGFLPAPGIIALFDPALGPRVRVDTGVSRGTRVPPDFDSLIAKVMASGATREEARSRLSAALLDFDLAIEGGATNKGYLLDLLAAEDYQAGGVDTLWLDRWTADRDRDRPFAAEALVFAAMVAYRNLWRSERAHFYRDTSNITPDKVPALDGRELDLEYAGEQYRVRVFSVGSMRYRVQLDGRTVSARYGETGSHTARMVVSGRYMRATYDVTDSYLHVELEGRVHRFGRQTAGQVRAGAPSMVVGLHVQPGDRVDSGQPLGILEAMKMEIAFNAPVAGVVTEVRVRKGEQVAPGEVLVVIDPAKDATGNGLAVSRLELPFEEEPLSALFAGDAQAATGPDFLRASAAPAAIRKAALDAAAEEIRLIMLGYDVLPERFDKIVALLEAPLPQDLPLEFSQELLSLCDVLPAVADIELLFSRARAVGEGGVLGPSNNARMRIYVRRMHSRGAGLAEDFLTLLQRGLQHYGVTTLDYSDELERCVLRMFASQLEGDNRRRLVMAVMRRLLGLIDAGVSVSERPEQLAALSCLSGLRGELPNALVDTALEVQFRALEGTRRGEVDLDAMRKLQNWAERASFGGDFVEPPQELVADIALSPNMPLRHLQDWLLESNRLRRVAAVSAFLQKLHAPRVFTAYEGRTTAEGRAIDVVRYGGDRSVLAASLAADDVSEELPALCAYARDENIKVLEIFLLDEGEQARQQTLLTAASVLPPTMSCERLTLSFVDSLGTTTCESFIANKDGCPIRQELYGIHPEAAARIDLRRYANFRLERLPSAEDVYCFHAHAMEDEKDERIFVLADMRNRPRGDSRKAEDLIPLFERTFQDATRTMRLTLGARDPRRRLHWNRVVMHVSQPMLLEVVTAHRLARRLLPHVRHLGIEKTIVVLNLLNADRPNDPPRSVEAAFADLASSRLEVAWRRPRKNLLVPASAYERRVADARRKGQFYPYEVIRMLTHGDENTERDILADDEQNARPVLPVGQFEEYDLDPDASNGQPRAISVAGREAGANQAAVVFGVISTATSKVPEGMKRVLLLSDPSLAMGALAKPECDRVVAAIDLAEQMQVPVEWIPVSSGARISMESGTENMDATADVVRRIVTFTQTGGVIHLVITGINVGAQSYWDSLATMLMHTRGVLIMTPDASMVLTGRAALTASGSISAEDEVSIGGHERVMGPNGQAQYFAPDMVGALALLYQHYDYTYVVPGESGPRPSQTTDAATRDITSYGYLTSNGNTDGFATIGEVLDPETNPGRKRPFAMRALMRAVVDEDGGFLERWGSHAGAETAIVWDAHLGGYPVSLIGIESQNVPRLGYRPLDGPENWNGGTLFPQSSKKVARALNAASGNRPAVVLANLSGFDGSPESMRKLQLEYGAEIARAVVNFEGTIAFLVVSRYHGGAYVVFSRRLNDGIRAAAVEGSFASVIGGGPAAAVVFPREVQARVEADERVRDVRQKLARTPTPELRAEFERARQEVTIEKRAEVAAEFDQVHSVQRARQVGSLEEIVSPANIRPYLVSLIEPRS